MGKHFSFRTAARMGTVVMAGILLGMVALVIGTMIWSRHEIAGLQAAIEVNDAYNQTAMSAALSAIYSNQYEDTGDQNHLASFRTALQDTLLYESLTKQVGNDDDRAFLARLEARYAADLATAIQAIRSIETGEFDPAVFGETDSLNQITQALTDRAQQKREAALSNLRDVESTVNTISLGAILVLTLGMPLVVGSYILTRRYEHKETVRELELERLKQAALTDGLTGLANHRAFQEDLRREVSRASRYERPITIAMMDVDDFKEINDTHGHAQGDAVLSELSRLMSYIRGDDRAYRVGGDEFALIMPETDANDAVIALERLRATVEAGLPGNSISIGFASSSDLYSPEMLRDHADLALYEAKRCGKNQVLAFEPSLSEGIEITAAKTHAIRRVIERRHVTIWYQPIYHYGSKQLLAFEALLRLPEEPDIEGPEEAFRIAQGLGKARELDLLCVAQALLSADSLPPGVKLFINLDPATLTNSRFSVDQLVALVEASSIDPSRIVFEMTEHTIAPVKTLREQVTAIRDKGFGMALDDVGTGNAGLELMRLIEFDYVKIDRSVIIDASQGGQGRAVILAIVAFARETGAFMIAEGIEDVSLLRGIRLDEPGLRDFWVRGVQGFLLGEPRASMGSFLLPEQGEPAA